MIGNERMAAYLDSLNRGNGRFLDDLERRAAARRIPVIRPAMQELLKVLLACRAPQAVLEIGTAVGFSAILMAANTQEGCRITTVEKDGLRAAEARENFAASGYESRITLLEGDARELLAQLEGCYDLIFMDAAKAQYIRLLPDVLRLLGKGGLLVSDNVLQGGDLIESHYAVERRNRTIYRRMRDYLYVLKHTQGLVSAVLPVGDGAAVTVKTCGEVCLEDAGEGGGERPGTRGWEDV